MNGKVCHPGCAKVTQISMKLQTLMQFNVISFDLWKKIEVPKENLHMQVYLKIRQRLVLNGANRSNSSPGMSRIM